MQDEEDGSLRLRAKSFAGGENIGGNKRSTHLLRRAKTARPLFDSKSRQRKRRCSKDIPAIGVDGKPTTKPRERVIINVGGIKYHTFRTTLLQVPRTRLYYLMCIPVGRLHPDEYDARTNQYFFDRSPELFEHIMNYYRTGQLHVPRDVCWPLFDNELKFWGLDHSHLETCCWMIYRHHTDNEKTLKSLDAEDEQERFDPRLQIADRNKLQNFLIKLWALMDDPISSNAAKFIALFSLLTILLSVAVFCLETHEAFREEVKMNVTIDNGNETSWEIVTDEQPMTFIFYVETCCVIWFAIEFVLRLFSCPNKLSFCKKWLNIIDFLSIVPYIFDSLQPNNHATGILRVIRVCRVFRVFKLTRHSVGLKILWHTLHASLKELFILGIFMFLGVVIFASLIYYAEKLFEGPYQTDFSDIPRGFWWAVVTMTTLGYGDMVPSTFAGQIVGTMCALSGLLTIALPVPVIVSNFSLYYSHYQAKIKLPKTTIEEMQEKSLLKSNSEDENNTNGGNGTEEEMVRDVKKKNMTKMKSFMSSAAGYGSEIKVAIGSKHVGAIDPPFDERRERRRALRKMVRSRDSGNPPLDEAVNSSYETETEEAESPLRDLPMHLNDRTASGVIEPWSIKEDDEDAPLVLPLQINCDPLGASATSSAMDDYLTSSGAAESSKHFKETNLSEI